MWRQQHGVGLEEERILSGKSRFGKPRLNQDIHQGGGRSQVLARKYGERSLLMIAHNLVGVM